MACPHAPYSERERATPHPDACGVCWACRGDEPPLSLMPNPDGLTRAEEREIAAGEAHAQAALDAYYRGDIDNPYEWHGRAPL